MGWLSDVKSFFTRRNLVHYGLGALLGTALTRGGLWFSRFEMDPVRNAFFWVCVPLAFLLAIGLLDGLQRPRFSVSVARAHLANEGDAGSSGGLVVTLVNRGAPGAVMGMKVRIRPAGAPSWSDAQIVWLDSATVRQDAGDLRYSATSMLASKTVDPVPRGAALTGLLPFQTAARFKDVNRPGTTFEVTVFDVFGRRARGVASADGFPQNDFVRFLGMDAEVHPARTAASEDESQG